MREQTRRRCRHGYPLIPMTPVDFFHKQQCARELQALVSRGVVFILLTWLRVAKARLHFLWAGRAKRGRFRRKAYIVGPGKGRRGRLSGRGGRPKTDPRHRRSDPRRPRAVGVVHRALGPHRRTPKLARTTPIFRLPRRWVGETRLHDPRPPAALPAGGAFLSGATGGHKTLVRPPIRPILCQSPGSTPFYPVWRG